MNCPVKDDNLRKKKIKLPGEDHRVPMQNADEKYSDSIKV